MVFSRILVASDGSEFALRAAAAAAVIARAFGARLTVLHVLSPAVLAEPAGPADADVAAGGEDRAIEEAEDAAARRTGRVLEQAGVPYDIRCEAGHAADVILRIAESEGYDLVVVGSHGRSEVRSLLLGSTSNRVSHHAHCPVLIVK